MKKFTALFFAIACFCIVILTRCKKDTQQQPANIVGQWKWLYTMPVGPYADSTPANTGRSELLVFNGNQTWYRTQNGVKVDSGTYGTGHGSYQPYVGAGIFIYDSVRYYKPNVSTNMYDFYEILHTDTLVFNPYLGGSFSSYSLPYNGTKWWIKQ